MMKSFMCVAFAVLSATSGLAMADVPLNVLALSSEQADTACTQATTMVFKKTSDGTAIDYVGSNETIHQCVYVNYRKDCTSECMSYEAWTAKNSDFSVALPRFTFTDYYETHFMNNETVEIHIETSKDPFSSYQF